MCIRDRSWGGMLNGLLTLRGAWDKVRENPVLKFFVVAVTGYGMATFEGPLLATKTFNKIGHFTDWVIGHVHIGALGWNGFIAFGMLYYILPILWRTKLWSVKLANWHFWLGTLGIIFYAVPMYISGFTQGLMWKQFNPDGTLVYKNYLDTVTAIIPYYEMRFVGGLLYFSGAILMVVNLIATVRSGSFQKETPVEAPALANIGTSRKQGESKHLWLERMPLYFTLLSVVALAAGGMTEIIPVSYTHLDVYKRQIICSVSLAVVFLIIFIISVKNGQFEDDESHAVRILLEDKNPEMDDKKSEEKNIQ